MIGLGTMHRIDQRLRQVFPEAMDLWFGELTVLLYGDFFQLPPVMERALYYAVDSNTSLQYIHESFEYTAILSRIMRQEGEDDESCQFQKALGELRSGTVTRESWKLLLTRTRNSISRDEAELFNDAIRLFNTNELADNVNRSRLI
jgi:ATP-dependent DNA helicase PIF1